MTVSSQHSVWQLGDYLTRLGDQQPHPAAHRALAKARITHPADLICLRWWMKEDPSLIRDSLNDATPDEAALLLARLIIGGVDSRAIENVIG